MGLAGQQCAGRPLEARPPLCPELAGNQTQRELLAAHAASGRVAHAYLLCGPQSIGKARVAVAFGRALVCEANADRRAPAQRPGIPCGRCTSCRLATSGTHPDLRVVTPEGGSLKISQVRDIRKESGYGAVLGDRRVWVLIDAETLTEEAQNALLKTLEEPPGACVFVLVSDDESALLPTVVSRCFVVRFHPVPRRDIQRVLTEGLGLAASEASVLSAVCDGRPGKALEWASQAVTRGEDARPPGLAVMRKAVLRAFRAALHGSLAERLEAAGDLEAMKEYVGDVLCVAQSVMRDVAVCGTGVDPMNPDIAQDIQELRKRLGVDGAMRCLESIGRTAAALEANANLRLALDALVVDLEGELAKGELAYDADRGWGSV